MATDWDRIVREHGSMVYGTAWRILGNAADAEDVVQDVFLQIHQLQQSHPVRYWVALLRRLASCRALDRLRQRRKTMPLDGLQLAAAIDAPDAALQERGDVPSGCARRSRSCRSGKAKCSACGILKTCPTSKSRKRCRSRPAPRPSRCTRRGPSWRPC